MDFLWWFNREIDKDNQLYQTKKEDTTLCMMSNFSYPRNTENLRDAIRSTSIFFENEMPPILMP